MQTSSSLADALLVIAEAFLAGKIAAADDPDVYQVIVHVGTDAPWPSASRLAFPRRRQRTAGGPGDPADPARCHVEDGPAVSVCTAQMLSCTAVLSWMRHDRDGTVLDLGRGAAPSAALRRAARERDKCRCRFPGCESRRIDLHHIQHWIHGGRTSLKNLISLCPVPPHAGARARVPYRRDARRRSPSTAPTAPPSRPARPCRRPTGRIEDCHDAEITPDTIIPPWYGERLDLDYAIYTCFANARTQQERQDQRDQAGDVPAPDLGRGTERLHRLDTTAMQRACSRLTGWRRGLSDRPARQTGGGGLAPLR